MEKEEPDGEIQTAVPGSGNDNHNLEILFLIVKVIRNIPKDIAFLNSHVLKEYH